MNGKEQFYALSPSIIKKNNSFYLSLNNAVPFFDVIASFEKIADKIDDISLTARGSGETVFEFKQNSIENYELDLCSILPSTLKSPFLLNGPTGYINKNGPNCWNAVLYFLKITPYIRFISESEFKYYLFYSGFFNEISPDDLQPGDIGVFFSSNGKKILHSFMCLHQDIIIHKKGFLRSSPYEIVMMSEMRKNYKEQYCINYYRSIDSSEIKRLLAPAQKKIEELNHLCMQLDYLFHNASPHSLIKMELLLRLTRSAFGKGSEVNLDDSPNLDLITSILLITTDTIFSFLSALLAPYFISIYDKNGICFKGHFHRLFREQNGYLKIVLFDAITFKKVVLQISDLQPDTLTLEYAYKKAV